MRPSDLYAAFEPWITKARTQWETYRSHVLRHEEFRLDRSYLPAVIELQDSPPSPTARYLLWGTFGFIFIALLWSILGHIDIIAMGQGKTVPTGRVKVIQPLQTAVVKAIYVQDGQQVKAGERLVDLDVTMTGADAERARQDLLLTQADITRLQALHDGKLPVFSVSLTTIDRTTEENLFGQAREKHAAEIANLKQQLLQKKHEREDAQAESTRLAKTLPLVSERAASYSRLAAKGYVAKNQYVSIEEQRLQTQYNLQSQRAKVEEATAAIAAIEQQVSATEASFQRDTLNELNDKSQKRAGLVQDLAKADELNRLQNLVSPIDGTVQELKVHTIGGVVTPAEELMKVVPHQDALEAEVMIPNRDIGFVHEGQPVRVKFEAYPFTRYGVVDGVVKKLSLDAIQDEKQGLLYVARIGLSKATLQVEDNEVALTPGLSLTAEIKTGKRRIIDYFLSPIEQYGSESIRER
ncbi:HlyD family type I secretion periplasmic adaptor subunit [Bradyrhizobium sp. SZCCHNS2002]|uniref:HlyD family type I secretion periplasmic adaptor subunit n=1 Tax=Bradyrhizobium sp. SZCCHNS2002 TaxID=3057302 RepID=UPI0029171007|nr:HlyD family type I secretion periplasmic adaptor subunit [Bradyrhizobium sp. SZCCHNS2002]